MSDCFFEYPARWSQLYEYLLSGDDARVKQALAHLEARDRALEDHLRNRPCGGGGGCTPIGWLSDLVDVTTEDGDAYSAAWTVDLSSGVPSDVDVMVMICHAVGFAQSVGGQFSIAQWSDPLPPPGSGNWDSMVGYSARGAAIGQALSASTTFSWPVAHVAASEVGLFLVSSDPASIEVSVQMLFGCGNATNWIPAI